MHGYRPKKAPIKPMRQDSDTADFVISDGSMSKQEFDQLAHKLEVALPMKQCSQFNAGVLLSIAFPSASFIHTIC
jgi:hypothetical protein